MLSKFLPTVDFRCLKLFSRKNTTFLCRIVSTMSKRELNSTLPTKGISRALPRSPCCSKWRITKNSIAKWSTIIFFRLPNYKRIEMQLASSRKWNTIITSGRTGTFAKMVACNQCAKPKSTMIFTSQLCRRFWKDIPGPVLSPLRSHKKRHTGATFFQCNRCRSESISRRIFIRHKLQKAPTGYQCEDCKVKFSQKTAHRGRTISADVTKKSYNGQRRRNRDSEQRFIVLCEKTFSSAYKMEHKDECYWARTPSNQEKRRHCCCASRTRFFKTARVVTNNLPYTCEHSFELR